MPVLTPVEVLEFFFRDVDFDRDWSPHAHATSTSTGTGLHTSTSTGTGLHTSTGTGLVAGWTHMPRFDTRWFPWSRGSQEATDAFDEEVIERFQDTLDALVDEDDMISQHDRPNDDFYPPDFSDFSKNAHSADSTRTAKDDIINLETSSRQRAVSSTSTARRREEQVSPGTSRNVLGEDQLESLSDVLAWRYQRQNKLSRHWREKFGILGYLAEIVLIDNLGRAIYRGTPKVFEKTDAMMVQCCLEALQLGLVDGGLLPASGIKNKKTVADEILGLFIVGADFCSPESRRRLTARQLAQPLTSVPGEDTLAPPTGKLGFTDRRRTSKAASQQGVLRGGSVDEDLQESCSGELRSTSSRVGGAGAGGGRRERPRGDVDHAAAVEVRPDVGDLNLFLFFFLLPLMHRESPKFHDQVVMPAFERVFGPESLAMVLERKHHDLLQRFGRYPHRNKVLGRPSTAEESAYLAQKPECIKW